LSVGSTARLCEKAIFSKMWSNEINSLQSRHVPKTGFAHSLLRLFIGPLLRLLLDRRGKAGALWVTGLPTSAQYSLHGAP
jgi:hypothetical protein